MSRRKPKRPDGDPLEVTPHERFERATHEPGAIAPYDVVIARMAKPILNEYARKGLGVYGEVREVIERISWSYQVPRVQVEADLHEMMRVFVENAHRQAAIDGMLVDQEGHRLPKLNGN